MKKLIKKINISWRIPGVFLTLILIVFLIGFPQLSHADALDTVWNIAKATAAAPILVALSTIAVLVMGVFGALNTLVIGAILQISKYNNFINEQPIKDAWVILRDMSNMFFILVLLIIAFATILRLDSYSLKKQLPKLIIMAVLINFSKTICGLIIDFSQVIMLTFVNAFSNNNGGGFVDWSKMATFFTSNFTNNFTTKDWSVLNVIIGMIIGIMFMIISGVVLVTALAVFVMRVVMLWIYIVLSPMAFLLSAIPQGQKYSSQWWGDFTKYVVSGPVLAFFIWLALTSSNAIKVIGGIDANSADQCFGLTQGMCLNTFLPFIISIGMMVGGLIITQQVGGAIGSAAGKGMQAVQGRFGPTPIRWGRERWEAYSSQRQSARKQKATVFGEKMFSAQQTVTGAVSGLARGTKRAVMGDRTLKSTIGGLAGSATGKTADYLSKKSKTFNKLRQWNNSYGNTRAERKKERERMFAARTMHEDKKNPGQTYKEFEDATGTKHKRIFKDGEIIKDEKGFKEMGDRMSHFYAGWTKGMTKARGISNTVNDSETDKTQKEMQAAGLTTAQLRDILTNSVSSRKDKLAAALQLAVKEGFSTGLRGKQEVKMAKQVIGDNSPLLKKFEDTIDKRFAHQNYDLTTDGGKRKFKERMDEGVFDGSSLHHSAYSEKDVLIQLKDYFKGGFSSAMQKVANRSGQHSDSLKEGLIDARNDDLKSGKPLYDEHTGLNSYAKLIARLHGDVYTAFNSSTDKNKMVYDKSSEDATTKFFEIAKTSWLDDNFNPDTLNLKEVERIYKVSAEEATKMVKSQMESIADGLTTTKLASMYRSGQSPELVARFLGAIKEYNPAKDKEVKNNNILSKVKIIEPDVKVKNTRGYRFDQVFEDLRQDKDDGEDYEP